MRTISSAGILSLLKLRSNRYSFVVPASTGERTSPAQERLDVDSRLRITGGQQRDRFVRLSAERDGWHPRIAERAHAV